MYNLCFRIQQGMCYGKKRVYEWVCSSMESINWTEPELQDDEEIIAQVQYMYTL